MKMFLLICVNIMVISKQISNIIATTFLESDYCHLDCKSYFDKDDLRMIDKTIQCRCPTFKNRNNQLVPKCTRPSKKCYQNHRNFSIKPLNSKSKNIILHRINEFRNNLGTTRRIWNNQNHFYLVPIDLKLVTWDKELETIAKWKSLTCVTEKVCVRSRFVSGTRHFTFSSNFDATMYDNIIDQWVQLSLKYYYQDKMNSLVISKRNVHLQIIFYSNLEKIGCSGHTYNDQTKKDTQFALDCVMGPGPPNYMYDKKMDLLDYIQNDQNETMLNLIIRCPLGYYPNEVYNNLCYKEIIPTHSTELSSISKVSNITVDTKILIMNKDKMKTNILSETISRSNYNLELSTTPMNRTIAPTKIIQIKNNVINTNPLKTNLLLDIITPTKVIHFENQDDLTSTITNKTNEIISLTKLTHKSTPQILIDQSLVSKNKNELSLEKEFISVFYTYLPIQNITLSLKSNQLSLETSKPEFKFSLNTNNSTQNDNNFTVLVEQLPEEIFTTTKANDENLNLPSKITVHASPKFDLHPSTILLNRTPDEHIFYSKSMRKTSNILPSRRIEIKTTNGQLRPTMYSEIKTTDVLTSEVATFHKSKDILLTNSKSYTSTDQLESGTITLNTKSDQEYPSSIMEINKPISELDSNKLHIHVSHLVAETATLNMKPDQEYTLNSTNMANIENISSFKTINNKPESELSLNKLNLIKGYLGQGDATLDKKPDTYSLFSRNVEKYSNILPTQTIAVKKLQPIIFNTFGSHMKLSSTPIDNKVESIQPKISKIHKGLGTMELKKIPLPLHSQNIKKITNILESQTNVPQISITELKPTIIPTYRTSFNKYSLHSTSLEKTSHLMQNIEHHHKSMNNLRPSIISISNFKNMLNYKTNQIQLPIQVIEKSSKQLAKIPSNIVQQIKATSNDNKLSKFRLSIQTVTIMPSNEEFLTINTKIILPNVTPELNRTLNKTVSIQQQNFEDQIIITRTKMNMKTLQSLETRISILNPFIELEISSYNISNATALLPKIKSIHLGNQMDRITIIKTVYPINKGTLTLSHQYKNTLAKYQTYSRSPINQFNGNQIEKKLLTLTSRIIISEKLNTIISGTSFPNIPQTLSKQYLPKLSDVIELDISEYNVSIEDRIWFPKVKTINLDHDIERVNITKTIDHSINTDTFILSLPTFTNDYTAVYSTIQTSKTNQYLLSTQHIKIITDFSKVTKVALSKTSDNSQIISTPSKTCMGKIFSTKVSIAPKESQILSNRVDLIKKLTNFIELEISQYNISNAPVLLPKIKSIYLGDQVDKIKVIKTIYPIHKGTLTLSQLEQFKNTFTKFQSSSTSFGNLLTSLDQTAQFDNNQANLMYTISEKPSQSDIKIQISSTTPIEIELINEKSFPKENKLSVKSTNFNSKLCDYRRNSIQDDVVSTKIQNVSLNKENRIKPSHVIQPMDSGFSKASVDKINDIDNNEKSLINQSVFIWNITTHLDTSSSTIYPTKIWDEEIKSSIQTTIIKTITFAETTENIIIPTIQPTFIWKIIPASQNTLKPTITWKLITNSNFNTSEEIPISQNIQKFTTTDGTSTITWDIMTNPTFIHNKNLTNITTNNHPIDAGHKITDSITFEIKSTNLPIIEKILTQSTKTPIILWKTIAKSSVIPTKTQTSDIEKNNMISFSIIKTPINQIDSNKTLSLIESNGRQVKIPNLEIKSTKFLTQITKTPFISWATKLITNFIPSQVQTLSFSKKFIESNLSPTKTLVTTYTYSTIKTEMIMTQVTQKPIHSLNEAIKFNHDIRKLLNGDAGHKNTNCLEIKSTKHLTIENSPTQITKTPIISWKTIDKANFIPTKTLTRDMEDYKTNGYPFENIIPTKISILEIKSTQVNQPSIISSQAGDMKKIDNPFKDIIPTDIPTVSIIPNVLSKTPIVACNTESDRSNYKQLKISTNKVVPTYSNKTDDNKPTKYLTITQKPIIHWETRTSHRSQFQKDNTSFDYPFITQSILKTSRDEIVIQGTTVPNSSLGMITNNCITPMQFKTKIKPSNYIEFYNMGIHTIIKTIDSSFAISPTINQISNSKINDQKMLNLIKNITNTKTSQLSDTYQYETVKIDYEVIDLKKSKWTSGLVTTIMYPKTPQLNKSMNEINDEIIQTTPIIMKMFKTVVKTHDQNLQTKTMTKIISETRTILNPTKVYKQTKESEEVPNTKINRTTIVTTTTIPAEIKNLQRPTEKIKIPTFESKTAVFKSTVKQKEPNELIQAKTVILQPITKRVESQITEQENTATLQSPGTKTISVISPLEPELLEPNFRINTLQDEALQTNTVKRKTTSSNSINITQNLTIDSQETESNLNLQLTQINTTENEILQTNTTKTRLGNKITETTTLQAFAKKTTHEISPAKTVIIQPITTELNTSQKVTTVIVQPNTTELNDTSQKVKTVVVQPITTELNGTSQKETFQTKTEEIVSLNFSTDTSIKLNSTSTSVNTSKKETNTEDSRSNLHDFTTTIPESFQISTTKINWVSNIEPNTSTNLSVEIITVSTTKTEIIPSKVEHTIDQTIEQIIPNTVDYCNEPEDHFQIREDTHYGGYKNLRKSFQNNAGRSWSQNTDLKFLPFILILLIM